MKAIRPPMAAGRSEAILRTRLHLAAVVGLATGLVFAWAAAARGEEPALPTKTNSVGLVMPQAPVSESWQSPNKLTVAATLDKLRAEDGPAWLAALGAPSSSVLRRAALSPEQVDRMLARSIVFHGDVRRKEIALTFDDGPHPGFTQRLLLALHDLSVPATFFVVGKQVEKYPELARLIDGMGYQIGNHTYNHCSLLKIPANYVPTEVIACGYAVKAAIGVTPKYFRPPGGEFDKPVAEEVAGMGYRMLLWTDDPGDFARPSVDQIVKRVVAHATPGGVILLHDGIEETIEALPRIVAELRQAGYEFVGVDEIVHEHDADLRSTPPPTEPAVYAKARPTRAGG